MATEQNQLPTPDIQPETIVTDDGGQNFNEQPAAQPQQSAQPEQREEEAPKAFVDEKRAAILAKAREKRAEDLQEFSGDVNDPAVMYGAQANADDMSPIELEALERRRQVQTGQQPQQQGQQPAARTLNGIDPKLLSVQIPTVVNGEQSFVTVEDLIRREQQTRAADQKLELAKQLLRETQVYQRQQPQPGNGDGYDEHTGQDFPVLDDGADRQRGNTSRRSQVDVTELAEKIQLGTPEEVASALETFITSAQRQTPQVDEATRVLTVLEDRNSQESLKSFAEKHPLVATNPVIQNETTRQIQREMVLDLLRAGWSQADLSAAAPDAPALTQLHKQARISRMRGIRSTDELLNAGYQGAIKSLRGILDTVQQPATTQAPGMQQREQRKQQLQNQPAARRMSPSLTAAAAPKTVDQSRSDAFARMRQARGQSV